MLKGITISSKQQNNTEKKLRNTRISIVFYGFIIALVLILLRLIYLQIGKREEFSSLGEKNFLRMEIIYPPRGNLYDCHHVLLASNRPVFDLFWQGEGAGKLSTYQQGILNKLEKLFNISLSSEQKVLEITYAERYARRVLLASDISFDRLCQVSEQFGTCSCLVVSNRFDRVYPHACFASHVLGYLSRVEKIGRSGVERVLQESLQGQTGYVKNIINSTGKCLSQKEYRDAKAGADVALTLDYELQKIAETLFDKDQSGAFILMDVETGAVRSLLSCPNFDPNAFLQPISEQAWQEKMTSNNPLLNRVTCALYPPASTFKLVTVAAALEEKIIDTHSEYFCRGYVEFGGRKYACMNHDGHGCVVTKQALVKSCNAYLFEIAKRLHVDRLAMYANRFGFGKKTNFMLPEQAGTVPTMAWKMAALGERIWKGEMLSICIGQGFVLATPMQVACMVASICSGNTIKPRILESEPIEKSPLQFSASTIFLLKDAMKEAAVSGTAKLLGCIRDVDVFAKTGTAQTCSLDREVTSKKQLEHAWVTGFFKAHAGGPWYAFAILVENVGSSRPALQAADKFLRAYIQLCKQKPDYFNSIQPIQNTKMEPA